MRFGTLTLLGLVALTAARHEAGEAQSSPATGVHEVTPENLDRELSGEATPAQLHPYAGNLVTVDAVADGDTLRLLLDTGGGQTLITPEAATRLGCTPHGRSVGYRMSGEQVVFAQCDGVTLDIGGVSFPHPRIAVWDLMSILPEGLPPLDGVLALDTFGDRPITLDLAGHRLVLETAQTLAARTREMKPVECRVATGLSGGDRTLFVKARCREPGWFLFDSGNLDVVQVAPHMMAEGDSARGIHEGVKLEIPGLGLIESPVKVTELLYDGVLSEEVLRRYVWTFDPGTGQLWGKQRN